MRASLLSLSLGVAALLALAPEQPAAAQEKVGINAAVNTDATGTPPGSAVRKLVIGQEVVHNERITTDAKGQTQILFLDGSSVSVGPNADLVIDEFVYDPATGTGKMTLTDIQGAMRFVGGKLSKQEGAVTLHIGTATIGVRGGVFVADVQPGGKTEVVFVYGKAVTVAGQSGCSQQLYRPGFAVDINGAGGCPDSPHQAPPGATGAIMAQLDGRSGGNGGATTVPTNATIANSPIPNTISNNIQVSIQEAGSNSPPAPTPPALTVQPPQVPTNQTQIASSQTQTVVTHPTPPAPPATTQVTGNIKDAFVTNTGFTNQTTSETSFTGTIQNQTLTAQSTSFPFTLGPLVPGTTTQATGQRTDNGNLTRGPATTSPDGDFFFADTVATGGDDVFFFGGTPVSPTFFAPTPTPQILAFNILPDYTLGSGSQGQTIPFLPSFAGGTLANPVVSPLYVVTQPNQTFGNFNAISNPNGTVPRTLQASLAINGQQGNQTAALVVSTGEFVTSTTSGNVTYEADVRGVYMPGGTSPLVHVASGATAVPDGTGNSLFGSSSIDGFVIDSNQLNANDQLISSTANSSQIGVVNGTTNFAFNQPVLATTLPTGVGTNRSLPAELGYFGGIAENGAGHPYVLTGDLVLTPNVTNSTFSAIFAGTDPFTQASSGVTSVVIPFGTVSGTDHARSTIIDNNIFGATENYTVPVQITTPGGATITYPTGSSGASTYPTAAMVSSGTVPGAANSLFQAAGATPCTCQYLQWGYWEANLPATNQGGPSNSVQSSYINTWVAGQPTVNMPATGTGMYSGAAIGTVNTASQTYLAAGGFSNTYNFGTNTGNISISNFDGANYTAAISGSSGSPGFAGSLGQTGGNRIGIVVGGFAGPGAAETGGTFSLHAPSGPSYIASGIFAGALTGPIH
jgi:hypothetical protein